MNGNKNGRLHKNRITRTFHLAPTTRAIRAALAVSVTMLALSGSGLALAAGTCVNAATPNTVSCNGDFTDLPGGSFIPVVDLTLILGDTAPTTVTPAAGVVGVDANWGGNVGVISHADITTVGADGIHAYGSTSATLDNYGDITTNVTATGANAADISAYGDVTVVNGGDILAYSTGSYAVTAVTAYSSHGNVSLDNLDTGTITANSMGGNAVAVNASAHLGSVDVTNSGSVSATAGNYVSATGINAVAGDFASITNSGSINVAAGNYGTATGVHAVGVSSASVTNSGSITGDGSTVYGVNAYASDGLASVGNTGSITLTGGNLTGIRAGGYHGTSYVDNAGDISLTAYNGKYSSTQAYGIRASSVNNSGSITVASNGPLGTARGIRARAYGNDPIVVENSGSITVSAPGLLGNAEGILAGSYQGGSVDIVNSGDINVTANPSKYGYASFAKGIDVDSVGDATIVNSGNISATTTSAGAVGINAFGEGYTQISNSGVIIAMAAGAATGIDAGAGHDGSIMVDNSGSITVAGGAAFGIQTGFANYTDGDVAVTNSGDIAVSSGFQAHAVNDYGSTGTGSVNFDNSGTITASTNIAANVGYTYNTIGGAAYGVNTVNMLGDTNITNSGSISSTLYSYSTFANGLGRYQAGATGLTAYSHNGDIGIVNSGSISASSEVRSKYFGTTATGVKVTNDFGDVALANSGSVNATALSDYRSYGGQTLATGILVNDFRGDATISNSGTGSITANSSTLHYGTASAIGIDAYTLVGSIGVTNAGAISANADSGATSFVGYYGATSDYGATTATGVRVTNTLGTTTRVTNSGTGAITAYASADHYGAASATGINAFAYYGDVGVTNAGSITATAHADDHSDIGDAASAIGVLVTNSSPVDGATTTVSNSGSGAITANASAYLSATAQGFAVTGSNVDVTSAGAISAMATADTVHGTALATGVYAYGSNLAFTLGAGSSINATANGNDGTATGLSLSGDIVAASNAGSINAQFNGAHGNTYGAIISSGGDLVFTNSGHITATDADYAVGVTLNSATSTTLVNSGSITAASTAAGSIAVLTGNSSDSIQNTGMLTGALVTGGGNDTLTNSVGGVWNVIGASTDFGTGDDMISNAGTIHLNNSAITLGTDPLGNVFTNSGLIASFGANRIDMGSANPNPFTNTGSVDMRNGATGDALTVAGDWSGSGSIGLDVSGLHNTSDQLHIAGNVAAGSTTSVNVNLLDLPTTAISSVQVVDVTGDSSAGSFVLGDVHFDTAKSFLVVQGVSLDSVIDATNAHPDTFSVGVAVTGLTDSGALAAAFVPGVQSLMNCEVGTWRQRMGVIDKMTQGHVSAWARAFQDSGTVNPDHIANNFGQGGNPAFDQDNSGQELGVDFGVTDSLSVGLLLGKAQGSQHLANGGVGRNKITGDTRGAYATWLTSKGFYLDASYRWMDFDARLDTVMGDTRTQGKAGTFNLEAGQDITLGDGFKVTPELQYTKTSVDQLETLTGALAGFTPKGGDSSRGRAGVRLSKDIGSGTVWTPYAAVSGVREFDGDSAFDINGTFSGATHTKGTSALVEGGLAMRTGKLSVFGGVNWQDGGALSSVVGGQLGVRYSW